jgi:hypothetical protein
MTLNLVNLVNLFSGQNEEALLSRSNNRLVNRAIGQKEVHMFTRFTDWQYQTPQSAPVHPSPAVTRHNELDPD